MGCVEPDGRPSRCGEYMLLAMWGPATPEQVAKDCHTPLFRVRSAIREFMEAGFVEKRGDAYVLTTKGMEKMEG